MSGGHKKHKRSSKYRTPKEWREPNVFVGFLADVGRYIRAEFVRAYGLLMIIRRCIGGLFLGLLVRLHLRRRDY